MVHPTFENRKEDIYVNDTDGFVFDSDYDSIITTSRRGYRNKSGDIVNPVIPGTGYHCHRMDH